MNREYRGIAAELPLDAFSGKTAMTRELTDNEKRAMFRYFDLSNEQLRMAGQHSSTRQPNRLTRTTRAAWKEGIEQNMRLPTFRREWKTVHKVLPDGYFTELANLVPLDERSTVDVVNRGAQARLIAPPPPTDRTAPSSAETL